MGRAFVLMTAMPPTTGHLKLIQFADALAKDFRSDWTFEYARPYLENTVNEITNRLHDCHLEGAACPSVPRSLPRQVTHPHSGHRPVLDRGVLGPIQRSGRPMA